MSTCSARLSPIAAVIAAVVNNLTILISAVTHSTIPCLVFPASVQQKKALKKRSHVVLNNAITHTVPTRNAYMYTGSPCVRDTSLQGTKCWFPMVSVIEGFHCICLKGDLVVSKTTFRWSHTTQHNQWLHQVINRPIALPLAKYCTSNLVIVELRLFLTQLGHHTILVCPCGIAFTVTIILPFSCRQSLSNLKRVSIVGTSFPHSSVFSWGAWNETR